MRSQLRLRVLMVVDLICRLGGLKLNDESLKFILFRISAVDVGRGENRQVEDPSFVGAGLLSTWV